LILKNPVKPKLFILFLCGCTLLSTALRAQSDTTALWPNGTELDFGYYETRGVERIDSLLLRNVTEESFIIENIRASCGCTAVDWPKEPIEPGAQVNIPVAFRCTKGGYVERHLDVYLSHLAKKERIYVVADCPVRK